MIELGWLIIVVAIRPVSEPPGFPFAFADLWPKPVWDGTTAVLNALIQVVTALNGTGERRTAGALLIISGLAITVIGYVAAIIVATHTRTRGNLPRIAVLGLVFQVTVLVTPGFLSSDAVSYAQYGRVAVVNGATPYETVWTGEGEPRTQWMGVSDRATVYGPLWTDLNAALARITAGLDPVLWVLSYRVLGMVALALSAVLLLRLLAVFGFDQPSREASLLMFAWNPLVVYEFVGGAHNDGLMVVLMLAGVIALATVQSRSRGALVGVVCFTLATLVKWVPAVMILLAATDGLRSLSDWRSRWRWVTAASAAILGVTVLMAAPWFDPHQPFAIATSAASVGDRYVNALWDVPSGWIASRFLDRSGLDPEAAKNVVRTFPLALLRIAFALYIGFEVARLWKVGPLSRLDATRAVVESATRIFLIGLLIVFNQVLAWYFTWPLAMSAALGWQHRLMKLAVAYSLLYLPLFYALHEGLLTQPAPLLVTYAVAPVVWIWLRDRPLPLRRTTTPAAP